MPTQVSPGDFLFDDVIADLDADALRKGSTQVALETAPPFGEYIFIEHNEAHAANLSRLRQQFSSIAPRIEIIAEDANVYLLQWCKMTDWQSTRAVVFLDVLAMASIVAHSTCIPYGSPEGSWAERLTRIFGTNNWREAFYRESNQSNLFAENPDVVKDADFKTIAIYWVARLESVFADVARNPLPLRNSRNVPIYLLSFAAANPRGAKTAVKIAQDILRGEYGSRLGD